MKLLTLVWSLAVKSIFFLDDCWDHVVSCNQPIAYSLGCWILRDIQIFLSVIEPGLYMWVKLHPGDISLVPVDIPTGNGWFCTWKKKTKFCATRGTRSRERCKTKNIEAPGALKKVRMCKSVKRRERREESPERWREPSWKAGGWAFRPSLGGLLVKLIRVGVVGLGRRAANFVRWFSGVRSMDGWIGSKPVDARTRTQLHAKTLSVVSLLGG